MRFADLDAITIDAFGTLAELEDPAPALQAALRERGLERSRAEIDAAFAAEGAYYRAHIHEGRDPASLRALQTRCARIFLAAAAGEDLGAEEFAPAYVGCLRFRVIEGVEPALRSLRARGLPLAVVGNWDFSLHDRLDELGLSHFFSLVLPAARKPDPGRLLEALEHLRVAPERALHIGDEHADEEAARLAGMFFQPAPLAPAAVAALT
jgi:HAD superfamily hydrolase (TIGR01509 family)